eukprot:maker-scaffold895_size84271-snap-gene-0.35 protein:Tk08203 transcript:maker-scaffold895_size84271-snap-gene-0.35-mRNA-1 annotation:"hypothetical protein LOTGIDRAFT_142487"
MLSFTSAVRWALAVLLIVTVPWAQGSSKNVEPKSELSASSSSPGEARDFNALSDSDTSLAGLSGLMSMALVGIVTSLYGNKNIRNDLYSSSVNRRDGHSHRPTSKYVNRIQNFESSMSNNLRASARGARRWARKGLRRSGEAVVSTVSVAGNGIRNLVLGARQVARSTHQGVRNVGYLAHRGVSRMGNGIARAGRVSTLGMSRVGSAARRGLSGFGRAYANTIARLGSVTARKIGNMGSTYRRGWNRFGHGMSRGLSRMGHNYRRGISRMGSAASQATSRIGSAASEGVSRIGELASDSAHQLGGLATNIVEVAANVPQKVVAVAKEKKVRDCLMQTICYASIPLMAQSPEQVRQRRSLVESLQKSEDGRASTLVNQDLILEDDSLKRKDGAALAIDDCEVFKCPMASIGRQAYGVMSRFGEPQPGY